MKRTAVIKVTVGVDARARCLRAFTVAANMTTTSSAVSLWLAGGASEFAKPGVAEEVLAAHLQVVLAVGRVTLCSQCAMRRDISPADTIPRIRMAGPAVFVEECLADGSHAMVF
jgi:predicted peroxiredoxin